MKHGTQKNNKGFTLLETLASLTVLIFGILGPLSLAFYSIRSASVSENYLTAFYLAQEAMEYVKNRRDSNVLKEETNWLRYMAPSGSGDGLCRDNRGCDVDVALPDSDPDSIRQCHPVNGCEKLRYDSASGLYGYNPGDPETAFIRKLKLTIISDYEEKIEITVSWQDKFGAKSFTFEENLFGWH